MNLEELPRAIKMSHEELKLLLDLLRTSQLALDELLMQGKQEYARDLEHGIRILKDEIKNSY